MDTFFSAVIGDLVSRSVSFVVDNYYRRHKGVEDKLQRLQRVLLRIDTTVEEAEGRHITNQAMLRQLEMLRQGMYGGHYMLDSFEYRGHGGDDEQVCGDRTVALPKFSSTKRLLSSPVRGNTENMHNIMLDDESVKKLDKMLSALETMIGDMVEFAMFLEGYPRIRQPYSMHLILDKVMFGRQMEKETVINFLLRPEHSGVSNLGVFPIVGAVRIGKSTLVEHVCLDEKVRRHFSLIVFFTGDNLGAESESALSASTGGVIKHQDPSTFSHGRSLVVIELAGDMEEETWRRLYTSSESTMEHGSKIIVTSQSEKIMAFGTSRTLMLKPLPQEAFWYFFKTLAFGGTNPDDQPKLVSMAMEIAVLLKGRFLGANTVGSLMRANLNVQFWRKVLQCVRNYTNKHLLMFGEHPTDLLLRDKPVNIWRMAGQYDVTICKVCQHSPQNSVPKLTSQDILTGKVTNQGKFDMVVWRSSIPPYYTYMASCASKAPRCSMVSKKRLRYTRF